MLNQFLHEQFTIAFEYGVAKPEMPESITQNLNPAFELRPYQTEKENALTFEDFKKKEIVLLADEAHHMDVQTRTQQLELELEEQKPSWENTVENIFNANTHNLLLEFTATHDYENPNIVDKYRNKIIYRYDLVNFRNDRFSKDVVLVHSDLDPQSRSLQALILNQYKEEVAASNGVNLKPVILFKAQRTIAQSQENKENFHIIFFKMKNRE